MQRARRRTLLGLASLALLPGCALRASPFFQGRIWSVRERSPLDEDALLRALRPTRYRLLGEVHDNPAHHAIRARLVDALGRSGLKPVVAFEQFDAVHDASLQESLGRRNLTPEQIADAVRFDREGWNWDFYRPIVEAALRHGMPLRAANLSRDEAMRIARSGAAPSGLGARWTAERQKALEAVIAEGHCKALPAKAIPGMVAAQRARDARLAQALGDAPRDGAVLIAGNGHVRRDFGVPLYLAGPSLSVGLIETAPGEELPPDEALPFDYAWLTSRATRPDPCDTFRRK